MKHTLLVLCGILSFGGTANAEIFRINPDPNASAESICVFWPQSSDTNANKSTNNNKTRICQFAIAQDRDNSDAKLYAEIDKTYSSCESKDETSPTRETECRAKILALRETWMAEDMGTLVRYEKHSRENPSTQGRTDRALANQAWWLATERVYSTFGQEYIAKVRGAEQMRNWAAQQQEQQRQQDEYRQKLADLGYRQITLLDLKVQASRLLDTKLAVTGMIYAPSNEIAMLVNDERDMNPVGLDMRQASDETRRRILSRCSSANSRCRFEVRGKLVRSSPPVIQLD